MKFSLFRKKDAGKAPVRTRKRGGAKEVTRTTYVFLALFLAMIAYLVWYTAFQSDSFISILAAYSSVNKFLQKISQKIGLFLT